MADTYDLTGEEWEALLRVNRGAPEASLVPATIMLRLVEAGLAQELSGRRRVSEKGKQLILRRRDAKRR